MSSKIHSVPLGQLTVFEYLRIYFSMQLQFFFLLNYFFLLMQLQFQIFPNYLFMQLQFFFLPELILHKYSVEGYMTLPSPSSNAAMWTVFCSAVERVQRTNQSALLCDTPNL